MQARDRNSRTGRRKPAGPTPYAERERVGIWRERLRMPDGRELLLRPIEPADAPLLIEGFKVLTPHEVRMRFMTPLKELGEQFADQLARIDPRRAFALVLTEPDRPGEALVGAVARLSVVEGKREAEFALVVGRPIAGQGLGKYLLCKLIQWSRRKRLDRLYGDVLLENEPMLHLVEDLGFTREHVPGEPGIVRVSKDLRRAQ